MLSTAAFNALLKTLEEPPSHVVFILCTTDPQKVPETIHSRCQRFDFRRIGHDSIVSRLGAVCVSEGVEFEGEALDLIAHRAEGGMRNALTALEQVIAFGEGKVTLRSCEDMLGSLDVEDMAEIVSAFGSSDAAACFSWTARYIETGADLAQFARDLAEHFRNMYVMSLAGNDVALDVSEATRRELAGELVQFGPDRLANVLAVLGDLLAELRSSTNPRLSFEIALTRMVRPESDITLSSLAARIEALEAGQGRPAASRPSERAVPASAPAPAPVSAPAPAPAPASVAASRPAAPVRPQAAPNVSPAVSAPASVPAPDRASTTERSAVAAEPASAPAASAAQTTPLFQNPAALQRVWQSALNALKRSKPAYSVMFLGARVDADPSGASIVISFPAANSFAFMAVQKPEVSGELASVLQQAAGFQVPFRIEKDAADSQASAPEPASVPQQTAAARPVPPAVSAPSGRSAAVRQDSTAPRPAAPAPAMPNLRRADGTREQPPAQPRPAASVPSARVEPAVEADMPKPAPKAKQVLPLPDDGVAKPRYVQEGIRPKEPAAAAAPAPVMPNLRQADGTRQMPVAAPDDDQVPLDAYEGMGYSDGDLPPWEEPAPSFAERARPESQPSPAPAVPQQAPAAEPVAIGPAPDELNDLLSAFGEGVVFEEIK